MTSTRANRIAKCLAVAAVLSPYVAQAKNPHPKSFNRYELKIEDVIRVDNPALKVTPDLTLIKDQPPVIDKRDFRTLQPGEYESETVLVRFKPDTAPGRRQAVHGQVGGAVTWRSAVVPGLVEVKIAGSVGQKVNEYLDIDDVMYAEPNYLSEPTGSSAGDPQQSNCWGIEPFEYGSSRACWAWPDFAIGATVAIIDTGTDTDHPDLADNIWVNPGEIPGNGIDDDNNGFIDDINGWNVKDGEANVEPCGDTHGTHVAGTVAARGANAFGIVGVAPFAKLMILKCNGPVASCTPPPGGTCCSGPCCGLFNTRAGVDYAIANGARVSNNSYGNSGFSQAMYDTILAGQAVGHLFVAAAGNGGNDGIGDNNDSTPFYPAGYDLQNVISVAAIDAAGNLGGFSNYGSTSVDIGAPGVNIYSTVDGGGFEGGWNGTSMASPHVAGVVSLIMGKYPSMEWWKVRTRVLEGADFTSSLNNLVSTDGRLNAFRALGYWIDVNWDGFFGGHFFEPFNEGQIFSAFQLTPTYGTMNFKPGSIPANEVNYFTWDKAMTLEAPLGPVTLGN